MDGLNCKARKRLTGDEGKLKLQKGGTMAGLMPAGGYFWIYLDFYNFKGFFINSNG